MYYVYELWNPITKLPFYVGKGSGNRVETHLKGTSDLNKAAKDEIASIRKNGLEPEIKLPYIDILVENEAYFLETQTIRKYGRRRYENNGLLTNISIDNRPPNGKGVKFSDRYGDKAAEVKRKMIESRQKGRGWRKLTEDEKRLRSIQTTGSKNPFFGKTHSEESKACVSKANKGNQYGAKIFVFVHNGVPFIVSGTFEKFCLEHGLPVATMQKILRTGTPTKSGRASGWMVYRDFEDIDVHADNIVELLEQRRIR